MFQNFLKVAIRNLIRQKAYALINIFGLAIGISCSILIVLFVIHESSYDSFHEKAGQIRQDYRHPATAAGYLASWWRLVYPC